MRTWTLNPSAPHQPTTASVEPKFRASATDGWVFGGDVKFYYFWQNSVDKYAVIDVDGFALFHGLACVQVGGGLFPGDRMAKLEVDGSLEILEWWNQPEVVSELVEVRW